MTTEVRIKKETLLSNARCDGIIQRYKNSHGELYYTERNLLTSDVGENEKKLYDKQIEALALSFLLSKEHLPHSEYCSIISN